jgi:hypothetical protein
MIKSANPLIKTADSLTLATLIAFLAATPTVAFSGSTDCTPSGPAALHACLHSAEFNVLDGLDVYTRDLSAYGTSRTASGVSEAAPVAARLSDGTQAKLIAARQLDVVTLRAFFHSAAFNIGDGLNVYGGNYGPYGESQPANRTDEVARLPR